MRILLAVAFMLLHIVILGEGVGPFKFGDVIKFPRLLGYSHYGIYVGGRKFEGTGKKDGDDIFHFTGDLKVQECKFGKVDKEASLVSKLTFGTFLAPRVDNSVDEKHPVKDGDEGIFKRIMKLATEGCGKYNLLSNNCEHVATDVRNDVQKSGQVEYIFYLAKCEVPKPTGKKARRWGKWGKRVFGLQ